jgi:hypothetical protein
MIMSYYKTEAHQGDGIRLEEYDLLLTVQKGHETITIQNSYITVNFPPPNQSLIDYFGCYISY